MTSANYGLGESCPLPRRCDQFPLTWVATRENPILVKDLSVYYRRVEALRGISCQIRSGGLTGIIGPNGAGKSTLLKAMLGLVKGKGKVIWGESSLVAHRSRIAYVPQRSMIDWDYPATVWDVVMMGRVKATGWFHRFSTASRQMALDALRRVEMDTLRDRAIKDLSGGQQQRVFIARALAQQAEIFFLDEPFIGIDQKTETVIFDIFHQLTTAGKTVVVVNHDLGATITHFDDLILLNQTLIAAGKREQVLTQDNLNRAYGGKVFFFSEST